MGSRRLVERRDCAAPGSVGGPQAGPGGGAVTERGPYAMEQAMLATLPDLLAQRDAATDKRERKALSSRIKTARMVIKWCRTRAGYVMP